MKNGIETDGYYYVDNYNEYFLYFECGFNELSDTLNSYRELGHSIEVCYITKGQLYTTTDEYAKVLIKITKLNEHTVF